MNVSVTSQIDTDSGSVTVTGDLESLASGGTELAVEFPLKLDVDRAINTQIVLNTLGFRCPLSGNIDESTAAALCDFQRNASLEQSGQVDAETLEALENLRHAWEGKDFLH